MTDTLVYKPITSTMPELPQVEALYNAAFPAEERPFSVKDAMAYIEKNGNVELAAAFDEGVMVGFYAIEVRENHIYLQFIAVNQQIRGKGYGGRILSKLLEENKDRVFFASIEKPVPGEDGFEIKTRRQQFYERNGMITVDRCRVVNGVKFIVVTNKTGEEFDRCYEEELVIEKKQFEEAEKLRR